VQTQAPDTVVVQLRGLPVPLAARAREHSEDLLREFALITADVVEQEAPAAGREVPVRLLDLVVRLAQQFFGWTSDADRRLESAIAAGTSVIDHEVELPYEASAATSEMARLLDEADRYCWTTDTLLELVTPPECVAYRRWCFAQVLDQLDGRHPVPWPESAAARAL
jgi:hypothetical protein